MFIMKKILKVHKNMVVQVFNSSIWEAEASIDLWKFKASLVHTILDS